MHSFYFQALQGLGSSDRRHFYFIFMNEYRTIFDFRLAEEIGAKEYVLLLLMAKNGKLSSDEFIRCTINELSEMSEIFTAKQINSVLGSLVSKKWLEYSTTKTKTMPQDRAKGYRMTQRLVDLFIVTNQ